jgi:hypothetical protein
MKWDTLAVEYTNLLRVLKDSTKYTECLINASRKVGVEENAEKTKHALLLDR